MAADLLSGAGGGVEHCVALQSFTLLVVVRRTGVVLVHYHTGI